MVEWRKIEDLGSYFGGLTGKTKKDFEDGNAKFITYMNVFANPSLDESTVGMVHINEGEKQNKVQKGDILFTGSSETPDEAGMSCVVTDDLYEDYYMNSFCFGLRLSNPEQFNLHYLKHLLRSHSIRNAISKTASGVTRFNISKARFGSILIPVPSLSDQHHIVGILDTFTSAIDNLKQLIEQRRKQYEYYRDQLLDMEGKEGVEMKALGEMCVIKTGKLNANAQVADGAYPFFTCDSKPYRIDKYAFDTEAILISGNGSQVGHLNYYKGRFNAYQRTYVLMDFCGIDVIYLLHYLKDTIRPYVMEKSKKGSVPYITLPMLQFFTVPVPSFAEQSRIVGILDTFEASIANLEQQLEMRGKQYEFYRNKLLDFE